MFFTIESPSPGELEVWLLFLNLLKSSSVETVGGSPLFLIVNCLLFNKIDILQEAEFVELIGVENKQDIQKLQSFFKQKSLYFEDFKSINARVTNSLHYMFDLRKNLELVLIQNPKVNFKNFDVIVAPEHDNLKGDNIISSKGAIHYITPTDIEKAKPYLINKV